MRLLAARMFLPPVPGAHPASVRLELGGEDLTLLREALASEIVARFPASGSTRGYVVSVRDVSDIRALLPRKAPTPADFLRACDLLIEFRGERYIRRPLGELLDVGDRLAIGIARIVGVQHGETVEIVTLVYQRDREHAERTRQMGAP